MKNAMIKIFSLLALFSFSLTGCGGAGNVDYANMYEDVDTENYDVMELVRMNDNLSTFAALADRVNLDLATEFTDGFTFFVPTNEAFENLPVDRYKELTDPANEAELTQFLRRHVLPQKVWANEFNESQAIETAVEEEITVRTGMNGEVSSVGGATIVKPDIEASNGVIHVVNSVVQPTSDVFAAE